MSIVSVIVSTDPMNPQKSFACMLWKFAYTDGEVLAHYFSKNSISGKLL